MSSQNDEPMDDEKDNHVTQAKPIKEVSWQKGLDEDGDNDIEMEEEKQNGEEAMKDEEDDKFEGFFFLNDEDVRLQKGINFLCVKTIFVLNGNKSLRNLFYSSFDFVGFDECLLLFEILFKSAKKIQKFGEP